MRGRTAAELVDDIERQIGDGSLGPGDRLPAVRALADALGLAPNTVAAAYRSLGVRGVVVGKGRHGTFVAARPPVAGPMAVEVPAGVTDLATGNPDPALLPDITAAVAAAVAGASTLYGGSDVDVDLGRLAVEGFRSDGIAADDVAVVAGALDGLERVLQAHVRPGDRVAIEDPAYASVIDLLGALTLTPVPCAVDDEGIRVEELAAAVGSGVSAVILTPRAQNPTGAALTRRRADEVRAVLADAPDVLLIEDDHAGPVAGAPFRSTSGVTDRWAVARSVAKSLGPDFRIAALAADDATLQRVRGRQRIGPGWVSHMLQRTVANLMEDPVVGETLDHAAGVYEDRRTAFRAALQGRGIESHGVSGLNVWVPVRDEAVVVAGMLQRGIAVRSGSPFRLKSGPGVRITTASMQDPEAVAAALASIVDGEKAMRSG